MCTLKIKKRIVAKQSIPYLGHGIDHSKWIIAWMSSNTCQFISLVFSKVIDI